MIWHGIRGGVALAAVGILAFATTSANADGTETLGPPSIALSPGSGFVVGGVGLFEPSADGYTNLSGEISVAVPGNATVQQVLLYWISEFYPQTGPASTASVNGLPVSGNSIGGPTNFFSVVYFEAFRADITHLGLVAPGNNTLEISDINSSFRTTGAGVLVVYDDGTGADLQIKDGLDLAYWRLSNPLDRIVPQTFAFASSPVARTANIPLFVGSVGDQRPNVVEVTIGNQVLVYNDLFTSLDGPEWDTQVLPVTIPAGVSQVTVELISADNNDSGRNPASMAWIMGALAIQDEDIPEDPCLPCDGKVTVLTIQYNGSVENAQVQVKHRNGPDRGQVIDTFTVSPGGSFTVYGDDRQGTLGPEIDILVNGSKNATFHTSCSQPIGPGSVSGDFLVLSGESLNGGLLCPMNGGGGSSCLPCDGKVTTLTLEYQGSVANAQVRVEQKKDNVIVFNGTVQPGESFSFVGVDKQNTLGTEILVYVNGVLNTKIHTSCSQPIGPGMVSGDFLVLSGESRNGGLLCPMNGGNGGGDPASGCDAGKPATLTMLYTGGSCTDSNHQQGSSASCSGNVNGAATVQIVVTDNSKPDDKKARVFFDGAVQLNDAFVVDSAAAGISRLRSNTFFHIYSTGGQLLQSIGVHTSCSQPLGLGDQFGSLLVVGFTADKGATPSSMPALVSDAPVLPKAVGCSAGSGAGPMAGTGDWIVVLMAAVLLGGAVSRRRKAEQR